MRYFKSQSNFVGPGKAAAAAQKKFEETFLKIFTFSAVFDIIFYRKIWA